MGKTMTIDEWKSEPWRFWRAMADAYWYGIDFCGFDKLDHDPHHRWFAEMGAAPHNFEEIDALWPTCRTVEEVREKIMSKAVYRRPNRFSLYMDPRDTYKTTCRVLTWIPWMILANPNWRFYVVRATATLAAKTVAAIQKILTNEIHMFFWPNIKGSPWSEAGNGFNIGMSPFNKDGTEKKSDSVFIDMTCTPLGRDSAKTGGHADVIVVDDLVDENDRDSQAWREANCDFVQDVVSLLDLSTNPRSMLMLNGTPWHPDDAYSKVQADAEEGKTIKIEGVDTSEFHWYIHCEGAKREDGSLRYPKLLPMALLEVLERRKGSVAFASQYLLKHISRQTMPFDPKRFHIYPPGTFRPEYFVLFCDPSMGVSEGDPSCIVALGAVRDNLGPKALVWDVDMELRSPSLIMRDIRRMVYRLGQIAPVRCVGMESNYMQALIPDLPKTEDEATVPDLMCPIYRVPSTAKRNKVQAILGLEDFIMNGRILWPEGFQVREGWTDALPQLTNFTLGGTTLHDDFPDALEGAFRLYLSERVQGAAMQNQQNSLGSAELGSGRLTEQDCLDRGMTRESVLQLWELRILLLKDNATPSALNMRNIPGLPQSIVAGPGQLTDPFGGLTVNPNTGKPLKRE